MAVGLVVSMVQKIVGLLTELPFVGYYVDLTMLWMMSLMRFCSGNKIATNLEKCTKPKNTLILFEYEGCPFCKKVRETLSVLNLDAIIYPCPRVTFKKYGVTTGSRYRNTVNELGGKSQFPFLIDVNCDKNGDFMHKDNNHNKNNIIDKIIDNKIDKKNYANAFKTYESDIINKHLWKTYGNREICVPPLNYNIGRLPYFGQISVMLCALFRCLPQHGVMKCESKNPHKLLTLYSFEASPYCKKVREVLASLEIAYKLVNIGHGAKKKRQEFRQKYGSFIAKWRKKTGFIIVPLLVDPNTNTTMVESADIKKYLLDTYKTGDFVKNDSHAYTTTKQA